MAEQLKIRGARHHNLKNIDLDIPKKKLVVISGLSGSGKSSLAFDTIYAEGQRRYVESLSAYARQFLEIMDKPDVDSIEGLSPAISIQQKTTSKNPRSTVGTITEIYDYMRLLYARIGIPHCTNCGRRISSQSIDTICDSIIRSFDKQKILVLAPVIAHKKGTHEKLFEKLHKDGYSRIRLDDKIVSLEDKIPPLDKQKWHDIEVVIDRIVASKAERSRIFEAVQTSIKETGGNVTVSADKKTESFSQNNACPHCGVSLGALEPRTFSFNSPFGRCEECDGLGQMMQFDMDLTIPDMSKSLLDRPIEAITPTTEHIYLEAIQALEIMGIPPDTPLNKLPRPILNFVLFGTVTDTIDSRIGDPTYVQAIKELGGILGVLKSMHASVYGLRRTWLDTFMTMHACRACDGNKLHAGALAVRICGKNIMDTCNLSISECYDFFSTLKLSPTEEYIARDILREVRDRLEFLLNVGLNYITLNRSSSTLSGGESQRIRLATQIGSNLTGVLYVLDEPTIGLHSRDNERLVKTLVKLRDLGNTIIVVEHDAEVIRSSDWVIDLGPGAGILGGNLVFQGTVPSLVSNSKSVTGKYLADDSLILLRERHREKRNRIVIKGASANNLKNIDVTIPLGMLVAVTGVSGSGKSTLVNDILYRGLYRLSNSSGARAGRHRGIIGADNIEKIIAIDQSPIGRTPRSNPATYVGVFTHIRELFAGTELSKQRGYKPGRFSFNVKSGRCSACEGDGVKRIEMQFLADVFVRCDECGGKRYNSSTLDIKYKGKTISDVLEMTAYEALKFFENIPVVHRQLQMIYAVGLEYVKLGQSSTTLSGGEAQRVKLAAELSRPSNSDTLYVLDEPTTGLHFADVQRLLDVLNRLVSRGNTVVVIEHNMDVIRNADWIVDLGPEGGDEGGQVVATGTPLQVSQAPGSYTGKYLSRILK